MLLIDNVTVSTREIHIAKSPDNLILEKFSISTMGAMNFTRWFVLVTPEARKIHHVQFLPVLSLLLHV